ncbi:tetratricopeptide repeat protein [Rhodonellum sp.]|uniref:tetratricopeptide repeat-containing sensor histidine kinase n=1 Tax=Rhodonellum sp. TaxID=2231180 RepID=UPI0027230BB2|nr:tetratricopeptide repeat protein [Rhodonellum sp.]MDO9554876.1 tetratricopeptide repeat protein [Rhodonellum sp.]
MYRKFIFLIVIAIIPNFTDARQKNADSLKQVIRQQPSGSLKIDALNKLTFLLRELDLEEALSYGETAEKMAVEFQDSLGLGRAMGNIGWIYYRLGKWEPAFRYSRTAYTIGVSQGDYREVAMVLNNLGALYYQQKNYVEALKKFKEAYGLGLQLNDPYVKIRSVNNIALNFSLIGELDSAMVYALEALKVNEQDGSHYFYSFTNRVIGDIHMGKGELSKAIDTYKHSLEVSSHQKLKSFETSVLHRLGNAYLKNGEISKSIQVLESGLEIARSNSFRDELLQIYKNLAKAYEESGDLQKAFIYQKFYIELNQELDSESDMNRLALVQGMFEVEKSETELLYLKSENELKAIKLDSVEKTVFFMTLAAVVFVVFLIWLFILNRKAEVTNINLKQEQVKVNLQKKELEIKSLELQDANTTKNSLFSILGHDLRAPVAQLKGVLDLIHQKELSKEEFESISNTLKRDVDALFVNLDNLLNWSRTQLDGFRVNMAELEVSEVILPCLNLFEYQASTKNVSFKILIQQNALIMADKDLLQVVLRNFISNALKFSKKGGVIAVFTEETALNTILKIQDYGIGMTKEQVEAITGVDILMKSSMGTEQERGTGLGLILCKKIIPMMDGAMEIQSEKGKGTLITLTLRKSTITLPAQVV